MHGRAFMGLSVEDPKGLLETLIEAANAHQDFAQLSANRSGLWPIILTACRHWRLPVPIEFTLGPMTGGTELEVDAETEAGESPHAAEEVSMAGVT